MAAEARSVGIKWNQILVLGKGPTHSWAIRKFYPETHRCVIAIGILDKPNKPGYRIPAALNKHIHYDLNSPELQNQDCLVVGGGETASEYCQYLVGRGNRVTSHTVSITLLRGLSWLRLRKGKRLSFAEAAVPTNTKQWLPQPMRDSIRVSLGPNQT